MTLEFLVKAYLIFATLTAMGCDRRKSKYLLRRALLWPAYWLYVVALIIHLMNCDLRRRNS